MELKHLKKLVNRYNQIWYNNTQNNLLAHGNLNLDNILFEINSLVCVCVFMSKDLFVFL